MKAYRTNSGRLHSFLISAIDENERLTSHPDRFTVEKESRYLLNRRLVRPQNLSGCCGEERNLLNLLHQESNPGLSGTPHSHYTDNTKECCSCCCYYYYYY